MVSASDSWCVEDEVVYYVGLPFVSYVKGKVRVPPGLGQCIEFR